MVSLAILLFVPPIRDWFFGNKMSVPDAMGLHHSSGQGAQASRPSGRYGCGKEPAQLAMDNLLPDYNWQQLGHTAIADENQKTLTMMMKVKELDFTTYVEKQSTEVVL